MSGRMKCKPTLKLCFLLLVTTEFFPERNEKFFYYWMHHSSKQGKQQLCSPALDSLAQAMNPTKKYLTVTLQRFILTKQQQSIRYQRNCQILTQKRSWINFSSIVLNQRNKINLKIQDWVKYQVNKNN